MHMIREINRSLIHEAIQTALDHRTHEPAHIDAQGYIIFTERLKRQTENACALKQAASVEKQMTINWGTLEECPLPTPLQGHIYTDNPLTFDAIYREIASVVDHINETEYNVPFKYSSSARQAIDHERNHIDVLNANVKMRGENAQGYYGVEIVEAHFPHPDPRFPVRTMLELDTHMAPKGSVGLDTYKAIFELDDSSPSDLLEL